MNLIKQHKVEKKLDVSRSTLIRMWKRGEFPKPTKIGNNNFWVEDAVNAWIEARFGGRAPAQQPAQQPARRRKADAAARRAAQEGGAA